MNRLVTKITLSGHFGLFNEYLFEGHAWNPTTRIAAVMEQYCEWVVEYEDTSEENILRKISTTQLDDFV